MLLLDVYPMLGPIMAQALIFFVLALLAVQARAGALSSGAVKAREVELETTAYPEKARKIAGAFNNQFETPVYFFAAAILSLMLQLQDIWMVGAAWLYIVSRVLHAVVFMTVNRVRPRFFMFFLGYVALAIMWIRIAVQVVTSGPPI